MIHEIKVQTKRVQAFAIGLGTVNGKAPQQKECFGHKHLKLDAERKVLLK